MSENVGNFLFLCRCLSVDDSPAGVAVLREDIEAGEIDWKEIARIAADHYLTPALWVAFLRKGMVEDLPHELLELLEEVHRLNVERNQRIKAQVLAIAASLNAIGVEPIVLKGAAHLFDSAYGDLGARMMTDADILIPEADLTAVLAALAKLGYRVEGEGVWGAHAYNYLSKPGEPVTVDVHRYLSMQRDIVAPDDVRRDALPIEIEGARLLVPSPTHRVFHNVFHAQLQNQNYRLGLVSLMQLCDFAALAHHHAGAVDWPWLKAAARRCGMSRALAAYVQNAVEMFGLRRSPEIPAGILARVHHRRCMAQLRYPAISAMARQWTAMTDVFTQRYITTHFGCSTNPLVINYYRLCMLFGILGKYRWQLIKRMGQRWRFGGHHSR